MRYRVVLYVAIALSLISFALPASADPGDPTVTTLDSFYTTGTSARLLGNIADVSIDDVVSRGFEFGTSTDYTTTLSQNNNVHPKLINTLTAQDDAAGKFNGPTNVEVDSLGNIYVVDASARIQKFDSAGNFITQWNWYDSSSPIPQEAASLATDSSNNVYVVNIINQVIQKYDTNGVFLGYFASGNIGDIDIDANDNVYIVTTTKVQVLDLDAQVLKEWNTNFQYSYGNSISVDAQGNVYVSDGNSQTVEKFDSNGTSLATFSTHADPNYCLGVESQPLHIYAAYDGSLYITNTYCELVQKLDSQGNFIQSFGSSTYSNAPGAFDTPREIVADLDGNLLVADTGNDRIQKLSSDGTYISDFGTFGSNIIRPLDTAIDSKGYSYVIDYGNGRVIKYDPTGKRVLTWGSQSFRPPLENNQFWGMTGIEIDNQDNVYVLGDNTIRKYDSSGNFISKFAFQGYGQQFIVDADTNIWISSDYDNSVRKYSQSGTLLLTFGGPGTSDGKFNAPRAMATDLNGDLFVVDGGNKRIQKFATDGTFLAKFGSGGSGDGQFSTPGAIAINSNGTIFVADGLYSRIHMFDGDTNFLGSITGIDAPDPTMVNGWFALTFDDTNTLYISDTSYGRVLVLSPYLSGDYAIQADDLACETIYHYRAFATNLSTTVYGQDHTFTTGECLGLPNVETQDASNLGEDYVTLNGNLLGTGGYPVVSVGFEYGTTASYGAQVNRTTSTNGEYLINLSDLACATTYHYRATATNNAGTVAGADSTFTTSGCTGTPIVQTWQDQPSANDARQLFAWVSDSGISDITAAGFLFGLTSQYGQVAVSTDFSASGSNQFTATTPSLECATEYHFNAYATNSQGTSFGADRTFTTADCPVAETDFSLDIGLVNDNKVESGDPVTYRFSVTNEGPNDSLFKGGLYIIFPLEFNFGSSTNSNINCMDMGSASAMDPGGYFAEHFGDHHLGMCQPSSQNLAFENDATISFDILGTANSDFTDNVTEMRAVYIAGEGETADSQAIDDAFENNIDFTTLGLNNNASSIYSNPTTTTTTTTTTATTTTTTTAPAPTTTTTTTTPAATTTTATTRPATTPVTTSKPTSSVPTNPTVTTKPGATTPTSTVPLASPEADEPTSTTTTAPAKVSGEVETNTSADPEIADAGGPSPLILGMFSVTGSNVWDIVVIGLFLVIIGVAIYLITRERKKLA